MGNTACLSVIADKVSFHSWHSGPGLFPAVPTHRLRMAAGVHRNARGERTLGCTKHGLRHDKEQSTHYNTLQSA